MRQVTLYMLGDSSILAGYFQQVFEVNLGLPTVFDGNYYRLTMTQTYYCLTFEIKMWHTKDAYENGEDSFFSENTRLEVQVF